jgi:hypothetical protein
VRCAETVLRIFHSWVARFSQDELTKPNTDMDFVSEVSSGEKSEDRSTRSNQNDYELNPEHPVPAGVFLDVCQA